MISGTGKDDMWGDAQVMLGLAKGGNDTFVFNVITATTKSRILARVFRI